MKSQPDRADESGLIKCLHCGYVGLPKYRQICPRCGAWLDPDTYYRSLAFQRNPPKLIRFYVALLSFGAIVGGLGTLIALFFIFTFANDDEFYVDSVAALIVVGLLLGLTVLLGATAASLYDMKKRGRILAIMLLGVGIALNGLVCVNLYFDSVKFSSGLSPMCGSIIGIPIQAYILRWLWDNGQRFR